MISITKTRNYWFIFSGVLVAISIVFLFLWKLNFGIDFTGGSLMEISFKENPPQSEDITNVIKSSGVVENLSIQQIGEKGFILKFKDIGEAEHQQMFQSIQAAYKENVAEERFNSIGPNVGQDLKQKTLKAIIIAIIGIVAYIAWAFRKVSKPVTSWKYGIIASLALFHDVIIALGVFSFLGKFYNVEVNAPFIAAVLTILGYSVNDTIVVFDRIRENLTKYYEGNLEHIIEKSIRETYVRSINTSMTVILTLFAILIFGGATIRDFALALIIGVVFGTYSSIFLASPLLLVFEKATKKNK